MSLRKNRFATLIATPNKKPLENQGVTFNLADRTGNNLKCKRLKISNLFRLLCGTVPHYFKNP